MPEWITPKTNWKYGDYYNFEDAERFVNNLLYLRTLALSCYQFFPSLLIWRGWRLNWGDYYTKYQLSDMEIPNIQDGVFDLFSKGLKTLFELQCLARYDDPYVIGNHLKWVTGYLDVDFELTPPRNSFSGYALKRPFNISDPDILGYIWRNDFNLGNLLCPFTSIRSTTGISTVTINKTDNLANTVFPNATGLNKIESMMASQFDHFTDLATMFPSNE